MTHYSTTIISDIKFMLRLFFYDMSHYVKLDDDNLHTPYFLRCEDIHSINFKIMKIHICKVSLFAIKFYL